jgi:hypothetical protein
VLAHKIDAHAFVIDQRFWFNLSLHGLIAPFEAGTLFLPFFAESRRCAGRAQERAGVCPPFVPAFAIGWFESIALFAAVALRLILEDRPIRRRCHRVGHARRPTSC